MNRITPEYTRRSVAAAMERSNPDLRTCTAYEVAIELTANDPVMKDYLGREEELIPFITDIITRRIRP